MASEPLDIKSEYVPPYDSELLSTPVESMNLSEHTLEIIKSGGVKTLRDIVMKRFHDLYKIKGIGKKSAVEISRALKLLNVDFKQSSVKKDEPSTKTPAVNNALKSEKTKDKDIKPFQRGGKPDRSFKNVNKRETPQSERENAPSDNKSKDRIKASQLLDRNSRDSYTVRDDKKRKTEPPIILKPEKNADGLYKFFAKGKWGYRNEKREEIIAPVYDEAFNFKEGMACVEINGLLGYINTLGELIIPCEYDTACSFSEGTASVTKNEKSGYIDKNGEIVIPLTYEACTPFENGISLVKQDGKWGYYERETGKIRLR